MKLLETKKLKTSLDSEVMYFVEDITAYSDVESLPKEKFNMEKFMTNFCYYVRCDIQENGSKFVLRNALDYWLGE